MMSVTGSRARRLILTGVVAAGLGAGATGVALAATGGPTATGTIHTTAKNHSSSSSPSGLSKGAPPKGLPMGAPPKGLPMGVPPRGLPKGGPPKGAPPAGAARGAPPGGGKPGSMGKNCARLGTGPNRTGSSGSLRPASS
jgi:hypothetical protein